MEPAKLSHEAIVHKKIVQNYYSKRASNYDKQKVRTWNSETGFESSLLNEIVEATRISTGFGLEVGVGSGRIFLPLNTETELHLVGIDLSRDMLNIAKKKASSHREKVDLLLADAEFLPLRNDSVSLSVCISVLHYLLFPNVALTEFSRVMERNGVFVYGDVTMHEMDVDGFVDELEKRHSRAHSKFYRPSEMRKLLDHHGINVVKSKTLAYRKSYASLTEDKAAYFGMKPHNVHRFLRKVKKEQKALYAMNEKEMTLFYTIIIGSKRIS